MKWAILEGLKRNVSNDSISDLLNSVFVSMYYDYLHYINEEDSSNILRYLKEIVPYYLKYNNISSDRLNMFFQKKENDLKSEEKVFEKIITFDEFIRMVQEYD